MPARPPKTPAKIGAEFFEVLGRCIAAWAAVDDELFRIFSECVSPRELAAIIYYRLPGLDIRLGLIDEIIRSMLPRLSKPGDHPHTSVKAWGELRAAFDKLLATRRRMAHHPVASRHPSSAPPGFYGYAFYGQIFNSSPTGESWLEIAAGEHERLRGRPTDQARLNIADLKDHLTNVRKLTNDLNAFLGDVLIPRREELLRPRTRPNPET
jgi:hypothetical protein